VRCLPLLVCLTIPAGCGRGNTGALDEADRSAATARRGAELIPAEWTVAEDTAADGEVITTSMQLPSARDISGLLKDESPRLILRCVGGKVSAYIEAEPGGNADSTLSELVPIQLDSAPACE
jgi:hypothetical protein